ncbi:hypothetical protein D9M69_248050 [compost metagenome]
MRATSFRGHGPYTIYWIPALARMTGVRRGLASLRLSRERGTALALNALQCGPKGERSE